MRSIVLLLLPLLAGCPLGDDPGFDDWCGAELCRWQLEAGEIRRAPTWHQADHGVELVGDRVVLTQIPSFGSVECLSFTTIADLDPAAAVYLEMDFRGDDQVEYRERIPSARWQPLTVLVNAPTWYDRVRLTLRKESAGHAVLARFEVARAEGCTGARVPLDNRPRGARCESGEQCAGGRCMTTCQ